MHKNKAEKWGVNDDTQIEKIKKEAYNQALEDAIENATLSLFDWEDGGFKEHKRKDNKFIINDGNYVLIDKDSILELKK